MLATLALLAVQLPTYSAILVPFGPGEVAHCVDLNDRGQVAGYTGEGASATGFVWKDGLQEIVAEPSVGAAYVRGISNDGTVIGFTRTGSLDVGFKWTHDAGLHKLMDGQREFMPLAIAEGDVVAGVLYDVLSRGYVVGVQRPNDSFRILGEAEGDWDAEVTAVNRNGKVVGHPGGQPFHAFVRSSGKAPVRLEAPLAGPGSKEFAETVGTSINTSGSVCGWTMKGQTAVGSVWSPEGKRTEVGEGIYLRDINDAGVAVGARVTGDAISPSTAVIWDRGHGVRDLNSMVALDKTKLVDARAVNNRGEILCSGVLNGSTFWFVLKPG